MKLAYLFLIGVVASPGCSYIHTVSGAWTSEDFARASNPETEEIAALCLRDYFSGYPPFREYRLYYLEVKEADWRATVARAKIPEPKALFSGPRDRFWSRDGFRDRQTGLPAYKVSMAQEGANNGVIEVFVSWNAGTNLGFDSRTYRLRKKDGAWAIIEKVQGPQA